jgi:hypothetical protein
MYVFVMLGSQKRNKNKGGGAFVDVDQKTEFDILQEQIDKAAKEMRGKKFVLDRYGKPIVVGKVNIESLPQFSLQLQADVNKARGNSRGGEPGAGGDFNNVGRKQVRVAGSRTIDENIFKPTISLATTLSGLENIQKIGAGVVVKSVKETRKGDPIPDDPSHMSRSQYMEKAAKTNRTITGGGGLGDSTINSKSQEFSKSQMSFNTLDTRGSLNDGGSVLLPASMKNIDYLPEFDQFGGGRRIGAPPKEQDLSDTDLGLGAVLSPTGGALRLSSLPKKPTDAQKANIDLLTGSPENGKPRDRDLPKNMRPVVERKHLPAPPLGQTTGHGMTLEKFNEKSSFASPDSRDKQQDDWTQQWRN